MVHSRVVVTVSCLLAISYGCSQHAPPTETGQTEVRQPEVEPALEPTEVAPTVTVSNCDYVAGQVDLSCPAPPSTFLTSGLQGTQLGQAWDAWAWSSFAAMNWPAAAAPGQIAFPTGFVRGVPDLTKAFTKAQPRDVTVWETFKEKRELFNDTALPQAWQSLTFDPKYAPATHGGEIAMCAGAEARFAALKTPPRVFARLTKTPPSAGGSSTGDETAEVASPPQESTDQLCAGYSGEYLKSCQRSFQPPDGGNASTLYTATDANGRFPPVGPRVFKGKPSATGFLYYEVKVNYDYYAYVAQPITVNKQQTSLNVYASAIAQAKVNRIVLPYRTSASSKPGQSNTNSVVSYSAANTASCYASGLKNCNLPGQSGISVAKLPALGSIQLKAAWVPAFLLDQPDTYHLTDAIYYKDSPGQRNGLCFDVQTFGLVGLHIIQRVHAGAPGIAPESAGGTYIYATWEHQSVGNGADYSYVNYSKFATNTEMPYPNTAAGLQVARLQNYPLPTTNNLNERVRPLLAGSVWANYRLIGTQFKAIDLGCKRPSPPNPDCATQAQMGEQASLAIGQPVYLANLLIETNRGLQQFQGQPPGQTPNANFFGDGKKVPKNFQFFSPTTPNMTFSGSAINMGGCMGCHGVAQTQGFAFSFVLQDGDKGTVPDTATSIAIPPAAFPPTPTPTPTPPP